MSKCKFFNENPWKMHNFHNKLSKKTKSIQLKGQINSFHATSLCRSK